MNDKILSVGIDIGTTTTQVIFSEITIQNTASSFFVPKVKIVDKRIIYKGKIHLTPLVSRKSINLEKLKSIIQEEYDRANVKKEHISTGAIIITGETARKENAQQVLNILSDFAGDFVVATAGADLESILAGYGSGAYQVSKNTSGKVVNFDIGGGTTNACVFNEGKIVDSFALHIGGKLIEFDDEGNVIYISEKIEKLLESLDLNINIGSKPELCHLTVLVSKFADIILKIGSNMNLSSEERELFIQHKNKELMAQIFMFSGGVAEFVYSDEVNTLKDTLKYKDIGPLLGVYIRSVLKKGKYKFLESREKIRATVIGAGSHSIKISGSTIIFDEEILPIKNIPIIKMTDDLLEDQDGIYEYVSEKIKMYDDSIVAISFKGPISPSYSQIQVIAGGIIKCFEAIKYYPIIIVVENDFAKALGQTIKTKCNFSRKVICIDGISTDNGDYIDIGKPVGGIIPVAVKTLIFSN
ncbi:ethanolamine ammonia-lyase reactivating factor EutA [Clostridium ljungdahlii]|uniref:Reactivating factor for ethanolamine ammonia lyase n=1 Tax=Clostridium ljungdahlii TaxID=1538 RepID=A0A162KP30_9CLOT|nr:ethanolamine ammonia-lyase reactivating factor EutA [Clostridium ljungdahlii]OAA84932.1 reactivating factor for ethanolamine ammonia lyase [Clostridium ljungdahlii]